MKLWELAYYDKGVYMEERHYAVTRIQAQGCIISRLKREVKFEVVRVIDESEVA